MSVSDNYRTYIVEQLAALPALSTRRMFGGIGIYSDALFFALIDDDVLFFKVDDSNLDDYVSRGMKAFMPFPGQQPSLGYFQVPPDVIEEEEELTRSARRSVEVSAEKDRLKPAPQKKRAPQKKKGPRRSSRRPSGRWKRS